MTQSHHFTFFPLITLSLLKIKSSSNFALFYFFSFFSLELIRGRRAKPKKPMFRPDAKGLNDAGQNIIPWVLNFVMMVK